MDPVTWALMIIVLSCIILYLGLKIRYSKPQYPLPPTPESNFFGNIPTCLYPKDTSRYVEFLDLGHIYHLHMGPVRYYVLNSYEAIHEAFIGQANVFSGRRKGPLVDLLIRGVGITSTDGPTSKEHRRFMLRLLREFGMGKPRIEGIILEECVALKEILEKEQGQPFITQYLFSTVTNNVIARLTFGERTGTEDTKFKEFCHHLEKTFRLRPVLIMVDIFPWLVKFKLARQIIDYYVDLIWHLEGTYDYIAEKVQQHTHMFESLTTSPTSRDEANNICEAYLIEQKGQEKANPGRHTFTETMLIGNLRDLFIGGTETTATALNWTMVLLAVNPEIQRRVQNEIKDQIGRDRAVVMADRQSLPYVCAVMDEALRISSILPMNVTRRVTEDTQLFGYHIPKDTQIYCNFYGIHHDPKLWERPTEMYPEHFLTPEGEYRPSKYLQAFSVGKRACLGESLARMEFFLVLVTIMQSFEVRLSDPNADVAAILNGIQGIFRHPLAHKICFTKIVD